MSHLCVILYESVVGSKRTSEYFLETKSQNFFKFWILTKNRENHKIQNILKNYRKNGFLRNWSSYGQPRNLQGTVSTCILDVFRISILQNLLFHSQNLASLYSKYEDTALFHIIYSHQGTNILPGETLPHHQTFSAKHHDLFTWCLRNYSCDRCQ